MITWLFDLDNTLHNASAAIFPHINRLMTRYVAQTLQTSEQEASELRVKYWHQYGATLLGLVRHHDIQAHHFLRATHQFDHLAAMIEAERGLAWALQRLPGRKILLTNAPERYARQVLFHLGIQSHFHACYAIEHMQVRGRFLPKPSRTMLAHVLAREKLKPHQCLLVEDTVANLKSAKSLGLRTVWVTGWGRAPQKTSVRPLGVDLKVQSVTQLPRAIARLL
jgi:putative hydrolase of the HAD superfamily